MKTRPLAGLAAVVAKPPIPSGFVTWPGWNIARDVALLPAT